MTHILQVLKREGAVADSFSMEAFSGQVMVVLSIVGGLGVLGILHVMATAVRHDTELHDLKLRVHRLRREQMERLRRMAEMNPMGSATRASGGGRGGHKKAA
ncbi:MAG: hypothetical protein WC718_15530 [Phycisphaerales bacterium]